MVDFGEMKMPLWLLEVVLNESESAIWEVKKTMHNVDLGIWRREEVKGEYAKVGLYL